MMKQFLNDDLAYAKAHSMIIFETNNLDDLRALVHRIHGATVYCDGTIESNNPSFGFSHPREKRDGYQKSLSHLVLYFTHDND